MRARDGQFTFFKLYFSAFWCSNSMSSMNLVPGQESRGYQRKSSQENPV